MIGFIGVKVAACAVLIAVAAASRAISKVHLGAASDPTMINVQWVSAIGDVLGNGTSTVQYGTSPRALSSTALGYNWTFTDPSTGTSRYLHAATLTGLTPGQQYFYRVGDPLDGWSPVFNFVATRTDFSTAAPLRVGLLGDMGWYNAQALSYIETEVANGDFDLVIHVGDYAYDLHDQDGNVGDQFQDAIEPVTAAVPYMGCPGNHEGALNFAHYTQRFRVFVGNGSNSGLTPANVSGIVPGLPNNHWYSWETGAGTPSGVHWLSMSTEAYFYYNGTAAQYAWMDADLAAVDRSRTPWVVVFGHRSIYCSCDGDCDGAATTVREGPYGMEALLNKYQVDMWINGHEHDYERNYPTFNFTRATDPSGGAPGGNAQNPEILVNPTAPVYIVSGCAGDQENHEPFTRPQPHYSAYRSNTFGYSRITVYNASHLLWEQVQTDTGQPATTGTVIDAMLLINNNHPAVTRV